MALRICFPLDVCSKNADALEKRGWTPRATAVVYVFRDMVSSESNESEGVDIAEVALEEGDAVEPESAAEEVDDDNDNADDDDEEVVVEDAGTGER